MPQCNTSDAVSVAALAECDRRDLESGFNAKTKSLVVEALIRMTLAGPTDECALRAVAVRLYGFWDSEDGRSPDGIRVRGCIGKLLNAVIDTIKISVTATSSRATAR